MVLNGKFSQPYSVYPVRARASGGAVNPLYNLELDTNELLSIPPFTQGTLYTNNFIFLHYGFFKFSVFSLFADAIQ